MYANNVGAQRYGFGYCCAASGSTVGLDYGAPAVDDVAWDQCFVGGYCNYGVFLSGCRQAALRVDFEPPTGKGTFLNKTIEWGIPAIYMGPWSDGLGDGGFEWTMTNGGTGGLLKTFTGLSFKNARLKFDGSLQTGRRQASFLPTPSLEHAGTIMTVNDCSHTTWGNVVVGGGSNTVLAFCNGTDWTVIGK
jgi:hypothetical protein